jgi:hypothetical protein
MSIPWDHHQKQTKTRCQSLVLLLEIHVSDSSRKLRTKHLALPTYHLLLQAKPATIDFPAAPSARRSWSNVDKIHWQAEFYVPHQ